MENDITIPFGIQVPEPSDLAPDLGKEIDLPTFGGRMSVQWDPTAGRIVESGRKRTIHLTSTHAENAFIRKALDTVAAFFNWLGSTAPQLKPDMRWKVVVRYAFRLLLIPDPALRVLVPNR